MNNLNENPPDRIQMIMELISGRGEERDIGEAVRCDIDKNIERYMDLIRRK